MGKSKNNIRASGKQNPYLTTEEDHLVLMVKEAAAPVYQTNNFSKIDLIHSGMTKKEVDHFKHQADLDYQSLAKMLNVTKATLFNRKNDQRFDTNLSERLMALADLYSYGQSVMGSRTQFNQWMKTENVALQRRPVDLADTLYGIEEIRKIVGRIEYGIYS